MNDNDPIDPGLLLKQVEAASIEHDFVSARTALDKLWRTCRGSGSETDRALVAMAQMYFDTGFHVGVKSIVGLRLSPFLELSVDEQTADLCGIAARSKMDELDIEAAIQLLKERAEIEIALTVNSRSTINLSDPSVLKNLSAETASERHLSKLLWTLIFLSDKLAIQGDVASAIRWLGETIPLTIRLSSGGVRNKIVYQTRRVLSAIKSVFSEFEAAADGLLQTLPDVGSVRLVIKELLEDDPFMVAREILISFTSHLGPTDGSAAETVKAVSGQLQDDADLRISLRARSWLELLCSVADYCSTHYQNTHHDRALEAEHLTDLLKLVKTQIDFIYGRTHYFDKNLFYCFMIAGTACFKLAILVPSERGDHVASGEAYGCLVLLTAGANTLYRVEGANLLAQLTFLRGRADAASFWSKAAANWWAQNISDDGPSSWVGEAAVSTRDGLARLLGNLGRLGEASFLRSGRVTANPIPMTVTETRLWSQIDSALEIYGSGDSAAKTSAAWELMKTAVEIQHLQTDGSLWTVYESKYSDEDFKTFPFSEAAFLSLSLSGSSPYEARGTLSVTLRASRHTIQWSATLPEQFGDLLLQIYTQINNPARSYEGNINPFNLWFERHVAGRLRTEAKQQGINTLVVKGSGPFAFLPLGVLGSPPLLHDFAIGRWEATTSYEKTDGLRSPIRLACVGATGLAETKGYLKYVADEVRSICALFPGSPEPVLGAAVKEGEIRQLLTEEATVLHVASHLIAHPANSSESRLVLGPDFTVSLGQLSRNVGKYDLVTLSGCATGLPDGTTMQSAAGLLINTGGAKSALTSLWSVEDESGEKVMRHFYQELSGPNRPSKPEALRRAQLAVATVQRHPYYWAPFQLSGNILGL